MPSHSERCEFETLSKELIALRNWLEDIDCCLAAMESMGTYWQPVYAVLEHVFDDEMHLLIFNAPHLFQVPGRNTDVRDAEWIATSYAQGS